MTTSGGDERERKLTLPRCETHECALPSSEIASLVVLAGSQTGRTIMVKSECLIGRSPEAQVQLSEEDVSRNHALIQKVTSGKYIIRDLKSKNGTLVNGLPVTERELKFGDRIRVGASAILMFTPYDRWEDQLLQYQRLDTIGQLAGSVAHDFSNILSAISANLGFLKGLSQETQCGDAEVKDCLEDIDKGVTRAMNLAQQLLSLARRDPKEERKFDLSKIIEEVTNLIRRSLTKKILIEMNVFPELITSGDPAQFHQLLMNLLFNARDAMPEGGTLVVNAQAVQLSKEQLSRLAPGLKPGLFIELKVADSGVGMDEKVRQRVFEPFFTTKAKGHGTGLGLASVFQITKSHGGFVTLDSEIGKGTVVTLYFPAVDVQTLQQTQDVNAFFELTEAKGIILVVGDDEIFPIKTRRLLERVGFTVKRVADRQALMDGYQNNLEQIKLLIIDFNAPKIDGVKLFQEIRQKNSSLKIMICAEHAQLSPARKLLTEGATGFLQRPFDVGALGDAISQALFGIKQGLS